PRHARSPRGPDRASGRVPRSGLANPLDPLLTGGIHVRDAQSSAGSRTQRSPSAGSWAIGARSGDAPATDTSAIFPWKNRAMRILSKVAGCSPQRVIHAAPRFRFVRPPDGVV